MSSSGNGKSGLTSGSNLTKNQHPSAARSKKTRQNYNWYQNLGREVFRQIGDYCSKSPWEVIIAFGVVFLMSFYVCEFPIHFSMNSGGIHLRESTAGWIQLEWIQFPVEHLFAFCAQAISIMLIIYRLRKAYLIRSSMIMWILLCYTSFMFVTFMIFITSRLGSKPNVIWDSWHIVIMMLDIPRVASLAHFVLCASSTAQIARIMGKGMSVLGPSFLSETVGKIMLVGMLFHTSSDLMVRVAVYNLVFNTLNFFAFCTIYPACLFLYLEMHQGNDEGELSHSRKANNCKLMVDKLRLFQESEASKNHKVYVCAIAALVAIHVTFFSCYLDSITGNMTKLLCCLGLLGLAGLTICWAYTSCSAQTQLENKDSLNTLLSFITKQVDDIDIVTDDNYEETSSSRSDEAILSSTDEGIGTDQKKPGVAKTVCVTHEDSSSDWSDHSTYKCGSNQKFQRLPVPDQSRVNAEIIASTSSSLQQPPTSMTPGSGMTKAAAQITPIATKDVRTIAECRDILKTDPTSLTDDEVIQLLETKDIKGHLLETVLENHLRGVEVRRKYLLKQPHMKHMKSLQDLPYTNYDYKVVMGACAESVIGVMTLPVGIVGPLPIKDGRDPSGQFHHYHVPMATTEGCLVASTNRGCSALRQAGGVTTVLYNDGMTRAPIPEFNSVIESANAYVWLKDLKNFEKCKQAFESTSRFAKLIQLDPTLSDRKLYVRFVASTGDAMGMNMLSKATEHTLKELSKFPDFPEFSVVSISGNLCTDKKPSAVNVIKGRGKSVTCEVTIPASILEKTLKTSTEKLVKTNLDKNYVGSALAGSIGGNNAHAANIVTAIFIATGQDVAQVIESSNCMTKMEEAGPDKKDLYMAVTMPSIEVGTVGGGTGLAAQGTCLDMLGVRGSQTGKPAGTNSKQLARVIAATVLAGELSLMSALTEGHSVKSHLRHNRSSATVPALANATPAPTSSMANIPTITDSVSTQRQISPKRS